MQRNEILVLYGDNIRRMTSKILEEAGLCDMIPDRDTRIGIKANLVGQVLPEDGATTHPEIVEELILYLQAHGFRNIVVLESSWVGDCTKDALDYCGYTQMLQKRGIPFWDMQEDKGVARDCAGMKLNLCRRALDIEYLINVPVLKGHCQTRMTCALKNMKGLIPASEKRRFHRMGLHTPIAHLNAFLHQDFILVDSICGDLTFEDGGNPVPQNRMIAGRDPVLVDTYGCRLIGIDPMEVGYIPLSESLGAGSMDIRNARVSVCDLEGRRLCTDECLCGWTGQNFRFAGRLPEGNAAFRQSGRSGILQRLLRIPPSRAANAGRRGAA